MKIAVAQINTTIGDFDGNCAKILNRMKWAEGKGANVIIFPELSVCGYPPRDLLEKSDFVRRNIETVDLIAKTTKDMTVAVGFVSMNDSKEGRALYNSAALLRNGKIIFVQNKTLLPEYDVFDEIRYFEPSVKCDVCKIGSINVGLSMCEDIWSLFEFKGRRIYHEDPIKKVVGAGADIVFNLSASPYTIGKDEIRKSLVCGAAKRFGKPVIYCNLIGGNDELVFDGRSFVVDGNGEVVHQAKGFAEDSFIVDLENLKPALLNKTSAVEEEVIVALKLGLTDYMRKCGFEKVVIGLSGGIDSAVVAAIASEALGSKKVTGVLMPSKYSSLSSVTDAQMLANNLGINTRTIPIGDIYDVYRKTLGYDKKSREVTVAEENIQARIRGTILMAISNSEKSLVLSTGNKSEVSVGYCTLYGDMAGGLALISDIPKTMVFAIARHINRDKEIIPIAIIGKPPSAELKPNQLDQDSLPPYEVLDPIIRAYIEDREGPDEIIALGFDDDIVKKVIRLIDTNEYKRRQSAPGIKITSKAFGLGRRFPIAWKA